MATTDPLMLTLQSMGSMIFLEHGVKQFDTNQLIQRRTYSSQRPRTSLSAKHDTESPTTFSHSHSHSHSDHHTVCLLTPPSPHLQSISHISHISHPLTTSYVNYHLPPQTCKTEIISLTHPSDPDPATHSIVVPPLTLKTTEPACLPRSRVRRRTRMNTVDRGENHKKDDIGAGSWNDPEESLITSDERSTNNDNAIFKPRRRRSVIPITYTRSLPPYGFPSSFVLDIATTSYRRASCPQPPTTIHSALHEVAPARNRAIKNEDFNEDLNEDVFGISKMLGIPPLLVHHPRKHR